MDQAITAVGDDGFHGVLAANDGTAGGAIAAMKGAGIDPSTIPVTGQDAELAAIQRILAGEQYMTVYKPIKPLADNAATLAVAVVNGEDPADSDVINGEEDNGTEQVPTAITDTIPVYAGQRRGHRRQGRLLDASRRSAPSSTRRPARTPGSSSRTNQPEARGESNDERRRQSTVQPASGSPRSEPLLALKGFTKSFGPVEALKDVDLEVAPGEVVALVGDNGAGKSTLIKAIAGAQPPDSGERQFDGQQVRLNTPARRDRPRDRDRLPGPRARENLDVVANLFLGQEVVGRRSRACACSTRRRWSRSRSSCSARSG